MLLDMLAYKCVDAGILYLEQEESSPSKSSFALSKPIETYGKQSLAQQQMPIQPQPKQPCPFLKKTERAATPLPAPQGQRPQGRPPAKHQFQIPKHAAASLSGPGLGPCLGKPPRDTDKAFNIPRKAVPAFKAKRGLSPRFGLWWLQAPQSITA